MKEISLNILDITKNSVKAGASLVKLMLNTDETGILTVTIIDNGCGMDKQMLDNVTDPFCTTRTTRKVGLGLPLLKMAAELTGGSLDIRSSTEAGNSGTTVIAVFDTKSIDCMPMGDIVSTVCILIAGSPEIDFEFSDIDMNRNVTLNTADLKAVLGDVSLAEPEIQMWIKEYLQEQYNCV